MRVFRNLLNTAARAVLGRVPGGLMSRWRLRDERFLDDPSTADLFAHWSSQRQVIADGRFTGWNHQFAVASELCVDFSRARGRRGGEPVADVLGQVESEEYYRFESGFFRLPAPFAYRMPFYLQAWMRSFATGVTKRVDQRHERVHFALTRYEYANVYHVMMDLYNAFLVLRFLDIDPRVVTLILVDGHPASIVDTFYEAFFGACRRIGEYSGTHRFATFVFGIPNRVTTLHPNLVESDHHLEAFRQSVLDAFGVPRRTTERVRKVLLVWRHDYRAHPRNPSGAIERKLANEEELLEAARAAFGDVEVRDVALETLSVSDQVRLIADTDVLVGMHGAGLAYAFLLPENGGVLELFANYAVPASQDLFHNISTLRGLQHRRWVNRDPRLERPGKRTYVPPSVLVDELTSLIESVHRRGDPS